MFTLARINRRILEKRANARSERIRAVAVIVRQSREPSLTEPSSHAYRAADILTCVHSVSYTMPCKHCRRTRSEARGNFERLATCAKR